MNLDELAGKWAQRWEDDQIYRFDPGAPRERVYAIDTPPPTVSGQLHMGSVFGYVQTDIIARFQRMLGKTVFYPMGWDDNGLPTERRVQRHYGVRCDPSLPYEPGFTPPSPSGGELPISRRNFIELCHELTTLDEKSFEEVFRTVGLSVDWSLLYTTIGERAQAVSQRAFLDSLARGDAYRAHAPTLWDTTFQTAVAQAELEDRTIQGAFHELRFGEVTVKTTRPELLPACVALVAHPSDERFRHLFGSMIATPLGGEVPVLAHQLADPGKGTGIAMVCTFGDTTDVIWQRELDLPIKPVLGFDGRFLPEVPHVGGLTVRQARARIVSLLGLTPEPITHAVKFYERGDRPIEIIPTGQWYLRNGGRDAALRQELLERGRALDWHPPHMHVRYEHWVNGLAGDWLVSRQRYFGVPIPLWYPLNDSGEPQFDEPIVPQALPTDPALDVPPGYEEVQRGKPNGFIGDADVLDTWATSTLSPAIAGYTGTMDLRPQGPEIIRTWLFGTVLRSFFKGELPWQHVMINGWILDPDRKKMSKSKGNVITPMGLLRKHSPDAVRYWAAAASPGTDTALDEGQMKVGRRLATKILNASRFVLGLPVSASFDEPLDQSMLAGLASTVAAARMALEGYDYARALEVTERFFWRFCDDYLELVKARSYESAPPALRTALSTLLRLFAPVLPYVTEEAWSWWQEGSIHRSPWPALPALGDPALLDLAGQAIGAVRKAKSAAKLSMKAPVSRLIVHCDQATWDLLAQAASDLRAAGNLAALEHRPSGTLRFEVEL